MKKEHVGLKVYRYYRGHHHVFIAANNKKEAKFLLLSDRSYKLDSPHLFYFGERVAGLRYFYKTPKIFMVTA